MKADYCGNVVPNPKKGYKSSICELLPRHEGPHHCADGSEWSWADEANSRGLIVVKPPPHPAIRGWG